MKAGVVRSRRLRVAFFASLGVLGLSCGAGIPVWNAAMAEYYAYAGYANAMGEYLRENSAYPSTLEVLEAFYAGKGNRTGCIPPAEERARPVYVAPSGGGRQCVMLSPPPRQRYNPCRVAIYASSAEGTADAHLVWRWAVPVPGGVDLASRPAGE